MVRSLIASVAMAATLGISTAAFAAGGAMATDVRNTDKGDASVVIHGSIKGGPGVNLNCSSTTAEVRGTGGFVKTDIKTTAGAGGACDFAAAVPQSVSRSAMSSCAGRVSLAQASEFHEFSTSERTFSSNSESLGKLGSKSLKGDITAIAPGSTSATITITAAP